MERFRAHKSRLLFTKEGLSKYAEIRDLLCLNTYCKAWETF